MKQVDLEWDKLTQIKTSRYRIKDNQLLTRQVNSECDKLAENETSWFRMR